MKIDIKNEKMNNTPKEESEKKINIRFPDFSRPQGKLIFFMVLGFIAIMLAPSNLSAGLGFVGLACGMWGIIQAISESS